MKSIIRFLPLVLLFNISCNKNNEAFPYRTYRVSFTLDGVPYSKVYGIDTLNGIGGISYGIASGQYTACGSSFYFGNAVRYINIQIGTVHGITPFDSASNYQSFRNNYAPGNKPYDHLWHVVQTEPGKAEIQLFDQQGNEWSSTTYTLNTYYTAVINQPTGKFTITGVREI